MMSYPYSRDQHGEKLHGHMDRLDTFTLLKKSGTKILQLVEFFGILKAPTQMTSPRKVEVDKILWVSLESRP